MAAKKTQSSKKKAGAAKVTKAQITAAGIKPKLHLHGEPRCTGGYHDGGCSGKGTEVTCNLIKKFGIRVCACLHV